MGSPGRQKLSLNIHKVRDEFRLTLHCYTTLYENRYLDVKKVEFWNLRKLNCRNKSPFEQHCQWVQELPDVGGGDGQPQGEEGQAPGGDQVVEGLVSHK